MEVAARRDELGVAAACITFAQAPMLALFARELALDLPLYGDPDRGAYAAFGFERGSVARVWLDPRVIASYAGLLARGRRPRPPEQDTLQLGGDVLVGEDGRVRWIYHSRGPEDRPSVAEIVAARG